MTKYTLFLLTIYITLIFIFGCAQPDNENSKQRTIKASATAVAKSDGTVKNVNPSDEDLKSLQIFTDKMNRINNQFPGPEIDHKNISKFFKVKNILSDSIIVLENGEKLGFAGCDCGDNDIPKEMLGPVFSQLNEASMINKWCKPIKQPGHLYFERYVALSKVN